MRESITTIIDPHLHLVDLTIGDYQWLRLENPPFWPDKKNISRSFSEQDLVLPDTLTLHSFVHIEAGFDNQHPQREIAWLEQNCRSKFRSIAFVDITVDDFTQRLDNLKEFPSLVGIRHILDDDALCILSHKNTQINLQKLADRQLIFEAQLPVDDIRSIEKLAVILQNTPNLSIVINHAGFADLGSLPFTHTSSWLTNMQRLANHPYCYVKSSGWEMQECNWSLEKANTVTTKLIDIFGIERVMLASNFPVSNLTKDYATLWAEYTVNSKFNKEQLTALCFSNAQRIYQLS